MDNGASSYHRFLNGDWSGLKEITEEYYRGLVQYLNRYLNNLQSAPIPVQKTVVAACTVVHRVTSES